MNFKLKLYIYFSIMILLFLSCNAWSDELIPKYFTVENKGIKVEYSENSCGILSKNVLLNVLDDSNAGDFDWTLMSSSSFREWILNKECKRLKTEMRLHGAKL